MSQIVHRFKPGSHLSGDPEKIADRLERIANKKGGDIRPPDVVADAKRKTSPLHPYFEWDDSTAAQEYRLAQARHLIRSIEVITSDDAEPVRAFHHVAVTSENEDDGRSYVTLDRASRDAELRKQIIRRLYGQARSLMREAKAFEAFADIVAAVEELPPLEQLEREAVA